MNDKARLIAISGICGAVAVVSVLLVSVIPYVALILGVVASLAVVVPMLLDARNLVYSLLVYGVSVTVSAVSGVFLGNISYIAVAVLFCMPFTIVKVYGESERGKRRLPTVVKWVLYYVILELSIGLTLLVSYLIAPAVFYATYSKTLLFWLLIGGAQLTVPIFDILMRGCLAGTRKLLSKIVK